MKIKIVPRSKIKVSRKSKSKYDSLKEAISRLKPGGDALRIEFSGQKELNSIRNIAYTYNRETGSTIKSTTNANEQAVFFFIERD
jgi:hypothetical protein